MNEVLWWIAIVLSIMLFYIAVFYLLFKHSGGEENFPTGGGSFGILYDRYVKREITSDQYQRMRKELKDHSPENIVQQFSRYF